MSRMPALGGGDTPPPVADKDAAETFGESDLSLSTTDAAVVSESVQIDGWNQSTEGWENGTTSLSNLSEWSGVSADWSTTSNALVGSTSIVLTADNSNISDTWSRGANAKSDVEFSVRVDNQTGTGFDSHKVTFEDADNNTVFEIDWQHDGDVFEQATGTVLGSWTAGTTYDVELVTDWSAGTFDVVINGTTEASGLSLGSTDGIESITHRISTDGTVNMTVDALTVPDDAVPSGTVYVEWPHPTDIYAWDVGVFQRSLDGETVDVYVEEDQSGGWTEVAGPIARGDSIPADPSNNVRYRVELSRQDSASNPTLDAIYRRFKL